MSGLEKRATYCEAADPSGTGHQSRAQSGPPVKKDTSQRSGCAVIELNLERSQSNKNVRTKWKSCTGTSLSGLGKGLKIRQSVAGAGLCHNSHLPTSCREEFLESFKTHAMCMSPCELAYPSFPGVPGPSLHRKPITVLEKISLLQLGLYPEHYGSTLRKGPLQH